MYEYKHDSNDILHNNVKNNTVTNIRYSSNEITSIYGLWSFKLIVNTDNIFDSLNNIYPFNTIYPEYTQYNKINDNKFINHNIKLNTYINLISNSIDNLINNYNNTTLKIYIYGEYGCGKTFLCKYIKLLCQNKINSENYKNGIFGHLCIHNYYKITNIKNVTKKITLIDNRLNPTLHILELNNDLDVKKKNHQIYYNNLFNYTSQNISIILVTSNNLIDKFLDRYDLIIHVKKCDHQMIKKMLEHYYSIKIDDNIIFKSDVFTPHDVVNYCINNTLHDSIKYFS
jgi:hypothetical protein